MFVEVVGTSRVEWICIGFTSWKIACLPWVKAAIATCVAVVANRLLIRRSIVNIWISVHNIVTHRQVKTSKSC